MYITNLDRKIDNIGEIKVIPTLCAWSDLLGFSTAFTESNWEPNDEKWKEIATRLQEMQIICARNMEPFYENCLVSNDAIIRNLDMYHKLQLFEISMWIRGLLYYFSSVNANEKGKGLPGMRLVLAAGKRLLHNVDKIITDDYVYNYTKPNPNEPGTATQKYGEKVVMYNHSFMQMNTAFSKGYIIDSIGSKGGISGNKFYLDISVIDFLKDYAAELGLSKKEIIDEEEKGIRRVAFVNKNNNWYYLGFELSNPVKIHSKNLETTVYKLDKFYPWDEDPKEFCFELDKFELPAILSGVQVPDNDEK